ncbi:MAG: hypothetical protein HC809_05905 [Gammaproteobacteria bacterium]|nr:hypothetical protein [Gammaproteobacteria bacterium]
MRWRGLERDEGLDCRFDEWSVDRERFSRQHEATRVWSPFNYSLMFNVIRDDGRLGVGGGMRIAIAGDGRESKTIISDRVRLLVDELGVSEALAVALPQDIAMPPPPGSRSALRQNGSRHDAERDRAAD